MFIFKHATIAITLSSDCHLRAILTGSSSSSTLQTHRFHTKPYQTMLISRRESTKSGTPFAPTVAVSSSLGQDCKYRPLKKPALGARSRNKSTAATGETPHYQPVPSVVCSSSLPLISGRATVRWKCIASRRVVGSAKIPPLQMLGGFSTTGQGNEDTLSLRRYLFGCVRMFVSLASAAALVVM